MRAEEAAVRVARIAVVLRLRGLSIGDRPAFDIHPQGIAYTSGRKSYSGRVPRRGLRDQRCLEVTENIIDFRTIWHFIYCLIPQGAMAPQSWFPIPKSSHFSLANIPFGIVSTAENSVPRPAIAIGEHALDLAELSAGNGFSSLPTIHNHLPVFSQPTLNAFAALGRPVHRAVRKYIQDILLDDTPHPEILRNNKALQAKCIIPLKDVQMHLPMQIGDYTDFFVGKNHAYNCGVMFRGPANALQPNYTHLPVGYHSRASSVVVSGTPIRRPKGQILENREAEPKIPSFSPTKLLDFELELGAFVCRENKMGEPIPISEAADGIFGLVLLNDWSARDIQLWEAVPLGPFNAKNFATSTSPWVVLMDALEPFRTKGIDNESELLPYLREEKNNVFDIRLEVDIARK
jgi:fumarylacetoacetase